jgi:hypothetical protein
MLDTGVLQDVNEEDHDGLQRLRVEFVIWKHLVFLGAVATAREGERLVLVCG